MSTIAILGATGRTGIPFVQQVLAAGHTVQALVRTPQKLTISHPRLRVIKGDALNQSDIDHVVAGSDGVVSLLGQDKTSQPDLQTQATKFIINSLRKHNLRRLISLTGGGVRDAGHDNPGFMDNLIVFIMKNVAGSGARNALMDGITHAEVIRGSGLDWTVVRGPMLTDDPAKGSYQVGYLGTVKGIKLTRADLAAFILTEWETGQWEGKFPFVTNG